MPSLFKLLPKLSILTAILFFNIDVNAQQKYYQLLEKDKFNKVEKKAGEALLKSPNDFTLNHIQALLYSSREFKKYNTNKAYDYIVVTQRIYADIADQKTRDKLQKKDINYTSLDKDLQTICLMALSYATEKNTISDFQYYLDYYLKADHEKKQIAKDNRNELAYSEAISINTIESFEYFIEKYPNAKERENAKSNRNELAFEIAQQINSIRSYQAFIDSYSDAAQISLAIELRDKVAFNLAERNNTSDAYMSFMKQYPNSHLQVKAELLYNKTHFIEKTVINDWSSYAKYKYENSWNPEVNTICDKIYDISIESKNVNALKWLFDNCSQFHQDSIVTSIYSIMSSDGELSTIESFTEDFEEYMYLFPDFITDAAKIQAALDLGITSSKNSTSNDGNSDPLSSRLKREGAKTGAVQISLMWNNFNDLDLHCIDPNGEEIYYNSKHSLSGGELDVDMNADGGRSIEPVENIFWREGGAPTGTYKVFVNHYSNHGCGTDCQDPSSFFVRIKNDHRIKEFRGSISHSTNSMLNKILICEFDFNNIPYGELELDNSTITALSEYIKDNGNKELSFISLQKLIKSDVDSEKWRSAISKINTFKNYITGDVEIKIENLLDILQGNDYQLEISKLQTINSEEGSSYYPVISANNQTIYFCGKNRLQNIGEEDVFVSHKVADSDEWDDPQLVNSISSYDQNEAPMALNTSETSMLLFKDGQLAISSKGTNGWGSTIPLPEAINSGSWTGDAMFSSDGNAIIFASVRHDGYNYSDEGLDKFHSTTKYASDLYVSLRISDEQWSDPINLGANINTSFSDRSPFLHPDMKTLYFSSDGHGGLGGYDLFKSTRLSDSCWNCWSSPVNMGKNINTTNDDWGYKVSTDGATGYFSKENKNKKQENIYSLDIPPYLKPNFVAEISGELRGLSNEPIAATIRWENLETGKIIGMSKSDPEDGSYFIVLPMGKIYGYFVEEFQYFPLSNNIDLRDSITPVTLEENIEMVTFDQMINEGISVPVNNLFFESNKYELLDYSIPELKRLAKIIIENKLLTEISGHTDNIGNNKFNMELSVNRASSVKKILENLGVDSESLKIVGHGETKPIESNDTRQGRKKNRRVEINFIKSITN